MAAVHPGSIVLVTGVNGHVASTVALRMLQMGYKIRGTVRRLARASYIEKEFAPFGDNFEIVEVPDIAVAGAFDAAMDGVDAVVHVSSPTTLDATEPDEQYIPAVNGTLGLLRSAQSRKAVKRVLYMSTIGTAILCAKDLTREPVTGDDWNIYSDKAAQDPSDPARGFHIYVGSKTAAEQAAFKFLSEQKPSFGFTTILGTFVFGPISKAIAPPGPRLDVSLGQLYATFANPPIRDGMSPIVSTPWIHAYDLADLFIASLVSDKTAGKRLLACAGKASWAEMGNTVRSRYPDRPFPPVNKDAPYVNFPCAEVIEYDTRLEEELLGGQWRTLEDAILSCAEDLVKKEAYGWDK